LHGAIIITLVKIHAGLQAWIESYSNKWCICDMTSRWQKLRRKPKLPSTNRTARIRLVRHNSDTRFVLQNLFKKITTIRYIRSHFNATQSHSTTMQSN
jgi:hypothetical protein